MILPQNMLEKDKYLALASSQKGEHIHNLIKEILELNPRGITVSQIDKATYFGRPTIWHHLEILASRAHCLKVEQGDTEVYHFNKILTSLKETQDRHYSYSFDLVGNIYGKFARIQTKQESKSGNISPICGLLISYNSLGDVVKTLIKLKKAI